MTNPILAQEVMLLAQKLDKAVPKTDKELKDLLDSIYATTKEAIESDELPKFKGIVEIATSKPVILSAIEKLKRNKGSNTPGVDDEVLRNNFLHKSFSEVQERIIEAFNNYRPNMVKRVYIEKQGKSELRPLGIPSMIDRIVQECIRLVIEPIFEAQFFQHSYGFRPWRSAQHAYERISDIVHKSGYHWIVEGDIKGFFDNVDHSVLLGKLWNMGVRDRRLLKIIKAMLKAGVMGEVKVSELGTPQGGILSPLLANIYLHSLDEFVTKGWEKKKTKFGYTRSDSKIEALRKRSNLKPAYFVRYADDWVLITNSKENAEKFKYKINKFLNEKLKLELSAEKTLITNIRNKAIKFVGYEYKVRRGKSRTGWITQSRPDKDRFNAKFKSLHEDVKKLRKAKDNYELASYILRINSQIRGLINYYRVTTSINLFMARYGWVLRRAGFQTVTKTKYGGGWMPANKVSNNPSAHEPYSMKIPAIKAGNSWIGLTDLIFVTHTPTPLYNQKRTPFTVEGRALQLQLSRRVPLKVRADNLFDPLSTNMGILGNRKRIYNLEFKLNRTRAYNRDKGKCMVCGEECLFDIHIHHKKPKLPMHLVNRTENLVTVHEKCHRKIHDGKDHSELDLKVWKKIQKYRDML